MRHIPHQAIHYLGALLGGLALLLIVSLSAHAELSDTSRDWAGANRAAVEQLIIPGYQQFATQSEALVKAVDQLCASPRTDTLMLAQSAFHSAMDAWQAVQLYRFGPVDDYLRYHRIQLWPDKRSTGSKQLKQLIASEDRTPLGTDQMRHASAGVQGFPALERLLWNSERSVPEGYSCELARAISRNIAQMAAEVSAEWRGGSRHFQQVVYTPGEENEEFAAHLEVTARLQNNLNTAFQFIAESKLAAPLGSEGGRPRLQKAENWRSQRSLRNLRLDLDAAEQLYRISFRPLLDDNAEGQAADAALLAAIDTLRTALAALHERPLETLLNDAAAKPQLDQLQAAATALHHTFATTIPAAIEMPLGFNSLDGD